jgi:hypothetical protein
MSTMVQALLHGLSMQAVADPAAFNRQEMLELCLDVLGTYLGVKAAPTGQSQAATTRKNTARTNGRHRSGPRSVASKR